MQFVFFDVFSCFQMWVCEQKSYNDYNLARHVMNNELDKTWTTPNKINLFYNETQS